MYELKNTDVLTLFYFLCWAAMTAGAARLRPFDSATALEGLTVIWRRMWSWKWVPRPFTKRECMYPRAIWRLIWAIAMLNVLSFCYFMRLLSDTNGPPTCSSVRSIACIAVGSLAVFGFYRMFAGLVLHFPRVFKDSRVRVLRTREAPGWCHFVSGALWALACWTFFSLVGGHNFYPFRAL